MGLAFPVLGYIGFESTGADGPYAAFVFLFFYSLLPIMLRLLAFVILKTGPSFIIDDVEEVAPLA